MYVTDVTLLMPGRSDVKLRSNQSNRRTWIRCFWAAILRTGTTNITKNMGLPPSHVAVRGKLIVHDFETISEIMIWEYQIAVQQHQFSFFVCSPLALGFASEFEFCFSETHTQTKYTFCVKCALCKCQLLVIVKYFNSPTPSIVTWRPSDVAAICENINDHVSNRRYCKGKSYCHV